jgi:hypothetical protein
VVELLEPAGEAQRQVEATLFSAQSHRLVVVGQHPVVEQRLLVDRVAAADMHLVALPEIPHPHHQVKEIAGGMLHRHP